MINKKEIMEGFYYMYDFPVPTRELQCYMYLHSRKQLTKRELYRYQTLYKGFTGERKFARLVQQRLTGDYLALYGLLLEDNGGNLFQIDSLLIFPNELRLIEVKYFEGEFIFQDDSLYGRQGQKEYRNPLHQLQRCSLSFRDLLHRLQVKLPLHPHLVFNHHEFTLFHAKPDTPILLPTQLNAFMKQLQQNNGKLQQYHLDLADRLRRLHVRHSPYEKFPEYEYDALRKGVLCHKCREGMEARYRKLICTKCNYSEFVDSGVLRNTIEFHELFPRRKIQIGVIEEWCGFLIQGRTINRILKEYLKMRSNGRSTYYVFHEKNNY